MSKKIETGDFVVIKGEEDVHPFTYMVHIRDVGGLTLVAKWCRTDSLTKVENKVKKELRKELKKVEKNDIFSR